MGNDKCEGAGENLLLLAGTSWLFAQEDMQGSVHTLLIAEAGHVALADALAVSGSTRNLVLLGDPQQLVQVAQGHIPRERRDPPSATCWVTSS